MKRSSKTILAAATLLLSILAICAMACMGTAWWILDRHEIGSPRDHRWLHRELDLKDDQLPQLDAMEASYAENRNLLLGEMRILQADLANQLLQKSRADDQVIDTIMKIHAVHGKLQELSIQHYFDMLAILPESKQGRLRELAAESLSEPP